MKIKEIKRLLELCALEDNLYCSGYRYIAGLDEVGRGSLAGPLIACAVILDRNKLFIENVNDSKKIESAVREKVFKAIIDSCICWAIVEVSAQKIDEINVGNANSFAFSEAIGRLRVKPDIILADYFKINTGVESIPLAKGESVSISIAAASILAKVTRDRIMVGMGKWYPEYGFSYNKGYATKKHLISLQRYGPCRIHRLSFTGVLN